MGTEKLNGTLIDLRLIVAGHLLLGLDQQLGAELFLCLYDYLHIRTEQFEELLLATRYGTGNDQRCTGIVDQHGIDLIDNGEVMLALHQVSWAGCHVITQIVKTELVVRTEGDVCLIRLSASLRVRTMLVNAIHGKTVEHIEWPHPFRVTLREVVIHGYDMHTVAGQCVEEDGQGCH